MGQSFFSLGSLVRMGLMRFWQMGKALVASASLGRVIEVTPWSAALMGVRTSQAARWSAGSRTAREATLKATVGVLLSSRGFIEGGSRLATTCCRFSALWCFFDGDWVRTV